MAVVLQAANDNEIDRIPVSGNLATLVVPRTTETALPIGTSLNIGTVAQEDIPFGSIVSNSVLAVTLTDNSGSTVLLNGEVEICFTAEALENLEDGCLGFVNEQGEWECEDSCLKSNSDGQVCGSTDHFTNFAILLTSETGGNTCSEFSDTQEDFRLIVASAVCIAVAVCIIILATLVIETKYRLRAYTIRKRLSHLAMFSTPVVAPPNESSSNNML